MLINANCVHVCYYRGKLLFGYIEAELAEKGGYDLIHPDDLTYYAAAHEECKYTRDIQPLYWRITNSLK